MPIADLDAYRVGWELIGDWDRYRSFAMGRAAVVQFSRGCPHECTYCGQHDFWTCWRHRDPVKLVDEIEDLYCRHDVCCFILADENPTAVRDEWCRFLQEMAARRLPVNFLTCMRAADIVRDADLLSLYRKAGILYALLGIESTRPDIIRRIKKESSVHEDRLACRLLRRHGIFSMMQYLVGFDDETWSSLRHTLRQLIDYDGDWLNAVYVTPHTWTEFGRRALHHPVVQLDQRKWDYRHLVLAQRYLRPWQVFAAVKWMEVWFHLRPGRVWRMLRMRDGFLRRQLLWCLVHTGMIAFREVLELLFSTSFSRRPVTLAEAARLNYAPAPR